VIEQKRFLYLTLIMAAVSLIVAGVTISILYKTAINEQKMRLVETAKSRASFIEAVALFNKSYGKNYPGGPEKATLTQIINAHEKFEGFGDTGEFTLARREGNKIVFVLRHRHFDLETPKPVSFDSKLAEPMRLALSGKSGTVVGLDYRGKMVLAAHEPVTVFGLGIVAKIDFDEIRRPFVKAGSIAIISALLIVMIGAMLFAKISNPVIRQLREYSKNLEELIETRTKSLKEKELLLKEVHHRVKNNMQMISSILILQAAALNDDKIREVFDECNDRIRSMAIVHEKLYRSQNLSNIDCKNYLETISNSLIESYKEDTQNIHLTLDVKDVFLNIDTAIPLGLIINELLTNSLKYAFKDADEGEIRIILQSIDENRFELKVKDNGTGLPENFDIKNTNSLGLQIVSLLSEGQLNGKININRDSGTEFHITFKKI